MKEYNRAFLNEVAKKEIGDAMKAEPKQEDNSRDAKIRESIKKANSFDWVKEEVQEMDEPIYGKNGKFIKNLTGKYWTNVIFKDPKDFLEFLGQENAYNAEFWNWLIRDDLFKRTIRGGDQEFYPAFFKIIPEEVLNNNANFRLLCDLLDVHDECFDQLEANPRTEQNIKEHWRHNSPQYVHLYRMWQGLKGDK